PHEIDEPLVVGWNQDVVLAENAMSEVAQQPAQLGTERRPAHRGQGALLAPREELPGEGLDHPLEPAEVRLQPLFPRHDPASGPAGSTPGLSFWRPPPPRLGPGPRPPDGPRPCPAVPAGLGRTSADPGWRRRATRSRMRPRVWALSARLLLPARGSPPRPPPVLRLSPPRVAREPVRSSPHPPPSWPRGGARAPRPRRPRRRRPAPPAPP